MISSNYGNLRVKYIHGFLESTSDNINRYINARGLEWFDKNKLLIGLSEIIIYTGINRPIDLAYLNPISSHLEIELNNRMNKLGSNSANAVWQLSIDYLSKNKIRSSFNLLYDEYVLDEIEIKKGKENGYAYSGKLSIPLDLLGKINCHIYCSYIYVGTPTFRHGSGENNFVQRDKPLGWDYGSDSNQLESGMVIYNNNFVSRFIYSNRKSGEENILKRPYDKYQDYLSGSFPSGTVITTNSFLTNIRYWWKPNISLMLNFEYFIEDYVANHVEFYVGFDLYYPINFKI